KLVWPSSAAKTAPPMRAAPQRPVRIVPPTHWPETRRRPITPACPPPPASPAPFPRPRCSQSPPTRYVLPPFPASNPPPPPPPTLHRRCFATNPDPPPPARRL